MCGNSTKTKFCRWCRKPIPQKAKICTECDLHQSWILVAAKNLVLFAAAFGVIVSAFLFTRDKINEVAANHSMPSLELVFFRTERSGIIFNSGRREVFVSHILMEIAILDDPLLSPIGKTLEPGVSIEFDTRSQITILNQSGENPSRIEIIPNPPPQILELMQIGGDYFPVVLADTDYQTEFINDEDATGSPEQVNCWIVFQVRGETPQKISFACNLVIGHRIVTKG